MRDHGDVVWWELVKAWGRRIWWQREAVGWGVLIGVLLVRGWVMLLMLWRREGGLGGEKGGE